MSHDPATAVEVRRSRRRTVTVSAFKEGGKTIIAIPARFSRAQEREWVDRMLAKLAAKERRLRPSDQALVERAQYLNERYLESQGLIGSVRWSSNQGRRWGSCTVATGEIRISNRLRGMPEWVLDYVLLHEITHTLEANHSKDFWALIDRYPRAKRAQGFLEGVTYTSEAGLDNVNFTPDEEVPFLEPVSLEPIEPSARPE